MNAFLFLVKKKYIRSQRKVFNFKFHSNCTQWCKTKAT